VQTLSDTTKEAQDTSNATQEAFQKIGSVAGTIARGIGTAGLAIGGALLAAVESTREYRAEMGLLDGAFKASGHSSAEAKRTYSELNAVLGDTGQAVEAAQHIAMIADNEKEMNTLTNIGTGVFQRFGQSLPLEGLMEGILHTSSLGEVQGSLSDALEWSGITAESFNEQLAKCSNEEERQDLIMKTLQDTYGGAAEQYRATNKDVMDARKAQEKLTDAFAELGAVGEPIITAIKDKVADLVSAAVPHLEKFVNKVKDIIKWIKNNQDEVNAWVGVIAGAGTAIGTFLLILNWGTIMTTAANAIKVVRTAILGMNAAMLANPIALIVAAVAGLVVGFIYLWNNVDGFRQFWTKAWATIKSAAVSAWNGIKSAWNGAKTFFSGIWKSVTGVFGNVGGWFRSKFSAAWSSIKSVFSGWGSFFGGLWTKIKSKFGSIGSSLGKSMGDAAKSALNKVLAAIEKAINKGIGLINGAIGVINKLPGVNVGKVSKVSFPRLARGGVLERGQVGLLEGSGAEAVVPLEHNRAWLSRVAEDLHELQGRNTYPVETTQITTMLSRVIDLLEDLAKLKIYLDGGVLVGELTPAIDNRLSDRWSHAMRGNVR
jgi:phage-related protein